MPRIFIDNQAYEVKDGQNLLHAALSLGFDVPYFCWHPAMGSVGACRQCAVQQFKDETDTKGKMIMSCMTPATEGTRISVDHPDAKAFRKSVIEWMMTNHPHDCPVCDEGGECHLQDMTVMTGQNYREFRFKKRTFRNQNLGPFINHEMNRCITCYRCVRYYKDTAGGDDLVQFASANRVFFGRYEDGSLENEFSGNLVEICPTGVFTDKPFKTVYNRKWDLQAAPSICQLCSVGCNISPSERYGGLRRVQNRYNSDINGYFLCDRGRFGHNFVNSKSRITESRGALTHLSLAGEGKTIGIGSPRASVESNFALRQLVGADNFYAGVSKQEAELTSLVIDILQSTPAFIPSLKDIENSDAILILGEDLTNTAPMMAFAVRQAAFQKGVREAAKAGIPSWNDTAIRNLVRDKRGDIFIASVAATKLDDVAKMTVRGEISTLTLPSPDQREREIFNTLSAAQNPVIISGISLGSRQIVQAAANFAMRLSALGKKVGLCFALPESNSMGLGLFGAKHLGDLVSEKKEYETAIVLENDLSRRLPEHEFEDFTKRFEQVIVLDSLETATTKAATSVLPAATFAEGTGTIINYEGRAQRYYRVFAPKEGIKDSWRWLAPRYETIDQLTHDLCAQMLVFSAMTEFKNADFRVNGQKIPRQTQAFSGRTAIAANLNIHEQKPPQDVDSPLAHSMEGFTNGTPAELTPLAWKPKWNSVQSWNKYQEEIGGELKGGHSGVRLLKTGSGQASEFSIRNEPKPEVDEFLVVGAHHIFGSEERAEVSAVGAKIPTPYLGMCEEDMTKMGVKEGQHVKLLIRAPSPWPSPLKGEGMALPIVRRDGLARGVVLLPVGLPGVDFVQLPAVGQIV